ncbi:hypothetical protein [Vibrio sp. 10N.286.49.B3]|uniref:hypothetical protein n=1 Tax=Vibrio sp. 10N.286.49.B3 TaxID=1880855 RepID=UPI001055F05E|nr:hypothetical protein [Vibrio sp. 10N.286.49.B3]
MLSHTVMAGEYVKVDNNEVEVSNSSSANSTAFGIESQHSVITAKEMTIFVQDDVQNKDFTLNDYQVLYFLASTNRIISSDHCAGQGTEPDYHLLISFLSPYLLGIATSATDLPSPLFHWTSNIRLSSRLSGWKESNLLYTHQHTRHS